MTTEQRELLSQAQASLQAAKILDAAGHHGFAVSRAYYTMFYVIQALLLGKRLAFSKHSGVHAAFGEHFVKAGIVPSTFHTSLIQAFELRHVGDYGRGRSVTRTESAEQISRAQEFLDLAARLIGPPPPSENP